MEPIPETSQEGSGPEEGVARDPVATALGEFCAESGVAFCALVDESGSVIASASRRGLAPRNLQEIGALSAGAFGATALLSQKLGESGFEGLYQAGKRWHYFLGPVTEDSFLLSVFDGETLVGIVRAVLERSRAAIVGSLDPARSRSFWP